MLNCGFFPRTYFLKLDFKIVFSFNYYTKLIIQQILYVLLYVWVCSIRFCYCCGCTRVARTQLCSTIFLGRQCDTLHHCYTIRSYNFLRLLFKTVNCLIENSSQNSCFTKLHLLLVYLYVWVYSISLCPCCDCRGNNNRNKMLNLI